MGILTGVAFITVDYRGVPITKPSSFCKNIRENESSISICYKSDVNGGLESTIRKKPYIYKCPAGLVDFSVPIIVDGKYLGAMISGQVRTDFNEVEGNSSVMQINESWKSDEKLLRGYNKTTYITYDKLIAISELVYTMINVIAEKSMIGFMQNELKESSTKLEEEILKRKELEERIKALEEENCHNKYYINSIIGKDEVSENKLSLCKELESALSYIEENYYKDIALNDVAAHINLTDSYVSRLFKKKLGINFNRYLAERKIKEAKKMLIEGEVNITEIAFSVGYNEPNYFCKVFKKLEGITPSAYREQYFQNRLI